LGDVNSLTREKLWVVVGPTASGKTALAVDLAEQVNGEIVSADSVQIYRHFDIGSGKPDADELARVAHHLIGVVEPTEDIDASRFAELADAAIADIVARGKTPIVCGGTFLWVRALLYGLVKAPPANDAIREQHARFVEQQGRAALHALLLDKDPESHARLNPNDFVRVSRALEVLELSGAPLSKLQAEHGFRAPRYHFELLGIRHTADDLTDRIRRRVQQMLEDGWEDEVRELLARGFGDTRPMASVGYRQVALAVRDVTPPSRETLRDEVVKVTRIFARRQRTWLRDQPVRWLAPGEKLDVSDASELER
jgi:tRNA dimethylallyltransferase